MTDCAPFEEQPEPRTEAMPGRWYRPERAAGSARAAWLLLGRSSHHVASRKMAARDCLPDKRSYASDRRQMPPPARRQVLSSPAPQSRLSPRPRSRFRVFAERSRRPDWPRLGIEADAVPDSPRRQAGPGGTRPPITAALAFARRARVRPRQSRAAADALPLALARVCAVFRDECFSCRACLVWAIASATFRSRKTNLRTWLLGRSCVA